MIEKQNIRIDEIGFGNLKLSQIPEEFCYGVDAVILADFATKLCKKHNTICDLGTGTGIIPLILSHKLAKGHITGVELQENSAKLAKENVKINGLQDRITIINSDILNLDDSFDCTFDVVVSNPPYMIKNGALKNDNKAKTIARHEGTAKLEDFFKIASRLLKERGEMFMVHRPSRLVDILAYGRSYKLEAKTLRMVSPYEGKAPNIVLVHFGKNSGKELKVMSTLNIRNENNVYSEEIMQIYEK